MNWINKNLSSFFGLLDLSSPLQAGQDQDRIECVRRAMLDMLSEHCHREQHRRLLELIWSAQDAMDLWFLRPLLMDAISKDRSEALAFELMWDLEAMFEGTIPQALRRQIPSQVIEAAQMSLSRHKI